MSTTTATTESPDPPAAPPPLPAVVADDLACLRCGYNLRTLPSSSACPECATLVATSLEAGLPTRDRPWLDVLQGGVTFVVVAMVLAPLPPLLVILFLILGKWFAVGPETIFLVVIPELLAATLWTIGAVELATREPGGREHATDQPARRWLALSPAFGVALTAGAIGALCATGGRCSGEILAAWLFLLVWGSQMVLAARLRCLFRRLAAPGLAQQAGGLMVLLWGCLVPLGTVWGKSMVDAVARARWVADDTARMWMAVLIVGLAALLAASFWSLGLLVALRRQAGAALRNAAALPVGAT